MQLKQNMECQKCKNFVYPIIDNHEDRVRLINEPHIYRLPNYIYPICNQVSEFIYYGE